MVKSEFGESSGVESTFEKDEQELATEKHEQDYQGADDIHDDDEEEDLEEDRSSPIKEESSSNNLQKEEEVLEPQREESNNIKKNLGFSIASIMGFDAKNEDDKNKSEKDACRVWRPQPIITSPQTTATTSSAAAMFFRQYSMAMAAAMSKQTAAAAAAVAAAASTSDDQQSQAAANNDSDSNIKPKTYPCPECGKVFNAHYNLTRHMPVHTGKVINLNIR